MENWKKIIKGIALGYLVKNYSKGFIAGVSIERVKKSGSGKNRYLVEMFKNEYFGILIDMEAKEIYHLNAYSKNRGYPNKDIIEYNLKKWSNPAVNHKRND